MEFEHGAEGGGVTGGEETDLEELILESNEFNQNPLHIKCQAKSRGIVNRSTGTTRRNNKDCLDTKTGNLLPAPGEFLSELGGRQKLINGFTYSRSKLEKNLRQTYQEEVDALGKTHKEGVGDGLEHTMEPVGRSEETGGTFNTSKEAVMGSNAKIPESDKSEVDAATASIELTEQNLWIDSKSRRRSREKSLIEDKLSQLDVPAALGKGAEQRKKVEEEGAANGTEHTEEQKENNDDAQSIFQDELMIYKDGEPHITYADGTDAAANGEDEQDGEQVEEEEEPEPPEMTKEEKKTMYDTVCEGNMDLLDDLLDIPGADIDMEWFGENLLMAAIRSAEPDMGAFLVDNGINRNFEAMRLEMRNPNTREMALYPISCRQMAIEHGMDEVADVIDELNNNLWSFIKRRPRNIRIKRPLEDKLREKHEIAEAERRRRYEMELMYRKKMMPDEVEAEEESVKDNASITSKTSFGSSYAFSDMTSVRGKHRHSRGGADSDGETLGDLAELPEGGKIRPEDGAVEEAMEEEEEEGPFFVQLGPTHMFPYPATEEAPKEVDPTHKYRSNKAFISRLCSNSSKFQASRQSSERSSPSTGSYRDESRLWMPQNNMANPELLASRPGRHTSFNTRLISPWKDDDDVIAKLKRRTKSAGTITENVRKFKTGNLGLTASNLLRKPVQHQPFFPSLIHAQLPHTTKDNPSQRRNSFQKHPGNSHPQNGLLSRSEGTFSRPNTTAPNYPGTFQSGFNNCTRGVGHTGWLSKAVHPSAGLVTKDSDDFYPTKSRLSNYTSVSRSYTSMTRRRTEALHIVSPT